MLSSSQSNHSIKNSSNDIPKPDLDVFNDNVFKDDDLIFVENKDIHQIMKISPAKLASIIKGDDLKLHDPDIFDCRSSAEFTGGHIIGAKNLTKFDNLVNFYNSNRGSNKCVIFHCEFSSKRGPKWAYIFRDLDRKTNNYQDLSFPNTYILDGGYKKFYENYPTLCSKEGYLPMDDLPKEAKIEANQLFKAETEKQNDLRLATPQLRKRRRYFGFFGFRKSSSQPVNVSESRLFANIHSTN